MATLLLQCVGPLQAWGTQSRFSVRDTEREPSKSGIIGLLAAALGRPRSHPLDDLAALRMGVRADKEGIMLRDWHTAGKGGYLKASGTIERKNLITSTRYYLADAAFLVGIESEDVGLLRQLHRALRDPRWGLFLGRKACPPSAPPFLPDGIMEMELLPALEVYPWLGSDPDRHEQLERLRVVIDDPDGSQMRRDLPLSFAKGDRRYVPRYVSTIFIAPPPYRPPFTLAKEV